MTTIKKGYLTPTIATSNFEIERGFCVSIEFTPGVESTTNSSAFGIDDMTESTDNAAW